MKECISEDHEIQRMRQILSIGTDDADVDQGRIEVPKKRSIAELINEVRQEKACDFVDEIENSKSYSLRDSQILVGSDLRVMEINEEGIISPLVLWSPKYIRTMTSLTFELCGFFCGHEIIEANRVSDTQISVKYKKIVNCKEEETSDPLNVIKIVFISEDEWNLVISFLFNYVKIDLWNSHFSWFSQKSYRSDGGEYRQVPPCDGYGWKLTVCGERRTHEFLGDCAVPKNWMKFERLLDALREKINRPAIDLAVHLVTPMLNYAVDS